MTILAVAMASFADSREMGNTNRERCRTITKILLLRAALFVYGALACIVIIVILSVIGDLAKIWVQDNGEQFRGWLESPEYKQYYERIQAECRRHCCCVDNAQEQEVSKSI